MCHSMAYSSTQTIAFWYDSVWLVLETVLESRVAVSDEIRALGTASNRPEGEAGGLIKSLRSKMLYVFG